MQECPKRILRLPYKSHNVRNVFFGFMLLFFTVTLTSSQMLCDPEFEHYIMPFVACHAYKKTFSEHATLGIKRVQHGHINQTSETHSVE